MLRGMSVAECENCTWLTVSIIMIISNVWENRVCIMIRHTIDMTGSVQGNGNGAERNKIC